MNHPDVSVTVEQYATQTVSVLGSGQSAWCVSDFDTTVGVERSRPRRWAYRNSQLPPSRFSARIAPSNRLATRFRMIPRVRYCR